MVSYLEQQLDLRQGGLHACGQSQRRWNSGSARLSESSLVECSSVVIEQPDLSNEGSSKKNNLPPPIPDGTHRWAGPGASWPAPRETGYTSEQFKGTSPKQRAVEDNNLTSSCGEYPVFQVHPRKFPDELERKKKEKVNVVWHRMSDLRLHDHEPVSRAHLASPKLPVIHLHIIEPFWFGKTRTGKFPKTGLLRAKFWLECVADLRKSLRQRGQDLYVCYGVSSSTAIKELSRIVDIMNIFTYKEVCSEELALEAEVVSALDSRSSTFVRVWGYTLHHIDDLQHLSRPPEKWITPYLSFGSFKKEIASCRVRPVGYEWQKVVGSNSFRLLPPPAVLTESEFWGKIPTLAELGFPLAEVSKVERGQEGQFLWKGGESSALQRLQEYIWERQALKQYIGTTDWSVTGKCQASQDQTTKLSPFLAFGCLSPRLLYWEAMRFEKSNRCKGVRGFINSLLWRDFYRFIVYFAWGDRMFHLYGPMNCGSVPGGHKTPTKWCCKHYNNIFGGSDPRLWTWGKDKVKFKRWQLGETGYPFVDAAMHELRETGYMHHLNRETVGWFFVRDLQLDWRLAAEWFESCLIDYDCVLNWGNWVYFILTQLPSREDDRPGGGPRYTLPRYSPYLMATQVLEWAKAHDPKAIYIKKWIPQLKRFPPDFAREPWLFEKINAFDFEDEDMLEFSSHGEQEAWSCEACTLQNRAARRTCAACGSSRASVTVGNIGDMGIYSSPPIVPPPPEEKVALGLCYQCNREALGYISDEDGSFFCASCWMKHTVEKVDNVDSNSTNQRTHIPHLVRGSIDDAWALIPALALPGQSASMCQIDAETSCNQEVRWVKARNDESSLPSKKSRSRWNVKGSHTEHGNT